MQGPGELGQLHDHKDTPATGCKRRCPRCGREGLANTIGNSMTLYLHRFVSKDRKMVYADSCLVVEENNCGRADSTT
jgi:hypothetical protein